MQIAIKHEDKLLNLITPNACNWVNGSQSNVSQGSNKTQEVMWKHEKTLFASNICYTLVSVFLEKSSL